MFKANIILSLESPRDYIIPHCYVYKLRYSYQLPVTDNHL